MEKGRDFPSDKTKEKTLEKNPKLSKDKRKVSYQNPSQYESKNAIHTLILSHKTAHSSL